MALTARIINRLLAPLDLRLVRGSTVNRFSPSRFPSAGYKAYPESPGKRAQVLTLACLGPDGKPSAILNVDQPIIAEAEFIVREQVGEMMLSFMIHDLYEPWISATHTAMSPDMPTHWPPGAHRVRMEFPSHILNCGRYYLRVGLGGVDDTRYDYHPDDGLSFELVANGDVKSHDIHSHGLLSVIPHFDCV